ncbi:hypothetical protein L596_027250 [Steinernema carpocapsae]|uniref:Uncharacterized protein n=1 Tax=Steinernema carpocapsae TaxID=34508 RepID=A0A4V5ZYF4_STECR|nr:hypothetical protein L596_027250 [Steinernema carpocapsae]
MASFLFFYALLTLVAADDRLLHYSLSVTKPLSFKSSDMCWDSTVDSATNVLNIVRCPYTACMTVYWEDEYGNEMAQIGCSSNPMFRRQLKEVDCLERHPPVNTGWVYQYM